MREILGLSLGRAMCFFLPCDIYWPVWGGGPCSGCEHQRDCLVGFGMFRADSGTNLHVIKQGEIVTGQPVTKLFQEKDF